MPELILWLALAAGLLVLILVLVITWTIWRMTMAHERIERHVASVERQLTAHLQSRSRA